MKKYLILTLIAFALIFFAGCSKENDVPVGVPPKPVSPSSDVEEDTVSVPLDTLKEYADRGSSMWELLQYILKDRFIVYKGAGGKWQYTPIDPALAKAEYDWNNLVEIKTAPRELSYVEDGETKSIKGIDVSRYQGEIDWEKVAGDGVEFVFVRLGYRGYETGKIVVDERFEENVKGAIENGIHTGVYFVTQAVNVAEAVEEAQFVIEVIKDYDITWPIVLDIEDAASATARTAEMTQEQRTDCAVAFCETVRESGYTPMLYCNIRWFVEKLDIYRIQDYQKWFAQYFSRPFFPYDFQI
ncbi:MAG: hypothetical protein GX975_06400, partial [Clostridiales bacterium]|nr:hypothetical protein [Clostridiales bacterium]